MRNEQDPEYRLEIEEIKASKDLTEKEKTVLIELAGFETIKEIEEALGPLTQEEEALELKALGPDFVKKVQERVREKIANLPTTEQ